MRGGGCGGEPALCAGAKCVAYVIRHGPPLPGHRRECIQDSQGLSDVASRAKTPKDEKALAQDVVNYMQRHSTMWHAVGCSVAMYCACCIP